MFKNAVTTLVQAVIALVAKFVSSFEIGTTKAGFLTRCVARIGCCHIRIDLIMLKQRVS
jgi:hypothetical protein